MVILEPLVVQFVNTVGWRRTEAPRESVPAYLELIDWGVRQGLVGGTEADRLREESESRPAEAMAAYRRAIRLREALFRMFEAHASDGTPDPNDLEILNAALAESAGRRRLEATSEGFRWTWSEAAGTDLDWILWPAAYSAAELLTGEMLGRLKACPGEGCGWIFIDASRNRSRRWCDMQSCGNRAKARRHYHRSRTEADTTPAQGVDA